MAILDCWWVQRQPVCERPDGCTGICLLCLYGQFFVPYLFAVWVLRRWRGNDQTDLPVCCVGYWTVCVVGPEVCTYLSKCVDEQIAVPECCVDKQMAVCLLCWLTDGCLPAVLINRWPFVWCIDEQLTVTECCVDKLTAVPGNWVLCCLSAGCTSVPVCCVDYWLTASCTCLLCWLTAGCTCLLCW